MSDGREAEDPRPGSPVRSGFQIMPPVWLSDSVPADPYAGGSGAEPQNGTPTAARSSVGPHEMTVSRGGLVMVRFVEVPELHDRLTVLNAFCALLFGTAVGIPTASGPVTHVEAVHSHGTSPTRINANEPVSRALLIRDGHDVAPWALGTPVHVDVNWIPSRRSISTQNVMAAIDELDMLLRSVKLAGLQRYDLLFRSACAYNNQANEETLILSWAVIEAVCSSLWRRRADSLAEGAPPGSAVERLNAATLLGLLRTTQVISRELFDALDELRKVRNRWIHQLRSVPRASAAMAVDLAGELLPIHDGGQPLRIPTLAGYAY